MDALEKAKKGMGKWWWSILQLRLLLTSNKIFMTIYPKFGLWKFWWKCDEEKIKGKIKWKK